VRTTRLEAFSDGVLAIVITVMVLELKTPEGHDFSDLVHTTGLGLLTYLLSFVYVGIYWNNHHHMFHLVDEVRGGVLWANLALLFCLSLFPFTTSWMDESHFEQSPVILFGLNLLVAAIAYYILQTVIIRQQGPLSPLQRAIGTDFKGKLSPIFYITGILSALIFGKPVGVGIALGCFVTVALIWIVPDRRIDRAVTDVRE
jgi:uncharacterized membrane protein